MNLGVYAGLARPRVAHAGQAPAAPTCTPPQAPFWNTTTQQWSCQTPLVESHPLIAVLLVAGFAVLFIGGIFLSIIFPATPTPMFVP